MVQAGAAVTSFLVLVLSSAQAFVLPSAKTSAGAAAEGPPATASATPASRLEFLRGVGAIATSAAGVSLLPRASNAEAFTDDVLGFKFETPDGWERDDAELSGRRKIIVYKSPKNPGANAFVAYTPVRGDFTTLGSFGTLDEVSMTVLPQAEGIKSRMVNSYTSKNSYVYDYVVSQEGRPETHIKTIWVLFPAQGQLATITAQCKEADYATLGPAIDKLIASVSKT